MKNRTKTTVVGFDDLPDETLLQIFSFFNPRELSAIALVSKRFNAFAEDDVLWQGQVNCTKEQLKANLEKQQRHRKQVEERTQDLLEHGKVIHVAFVGSWDDIKPVHNLMKKNDQGGIAYPTVVIERYQFTSYHLTHSLPCSLDFQVQSVRHVMIVCTSQVDEVIKLIQSGKNALSENQPIVFVLRDENIKNEDERTYYPYPLYHLNINNDDTSITFFQRVLSSLKEIAGKQEPEISEQENPDKHSNKSRCSVM